MKLLNTLFTDNILTEATTKVKIHDFEVSIFTLFDSKGISFQIIPKANDHEDFVNVPHIAREIKSFIQDKIGIPAVYDRRNHAAGFVFRLDELKTRQYFEGKLK